MQVEITQNKTYVEIGQSGETLVQPSEPASQIILVDSDAPAIVEIQEQPQTSLQVLEQKTVVEVVEQVVSVIGISSPSGGVNDHGELTGLADDDHSQYLLADGTRPASEIRLTPKLSSSGPEGTVFYAADDDHVWVATEL